MYLTFNPPVPFGGSDSMLIHWAEKVEQEAAMILPVLRSAYAQPTMLELFACSETLGIDWLVYTSVIRVRVPGSVEY